MPRPLPSSSALVAMQNQQSKSTGGRTNGAEAIAKDGRNTLSIHNHRRGLAMPLLKPLQHLFVANSTPIPTMLLTEGNSIGSGGEDDGGTEARQNQETTTSAKPTPPDNPHNDILMINNPKSSTLTRGQHKRYLQLQHEHHHNRTGDRTSSSTVSWTSARRKEFRTLRKLVQQEQGLYRAALEEFFVSHQDRFRVGIPSTFAQVNGHVSRMYQQQNEMMPLQYGKCRQVVSLLHVSKDIRLLQHSTAKESTKRRSVDEFSAQIILSEQDNDESVPKTVGNVATTTDRLVNGASIVPPSPPKIPPLQFLRNDKLALELAQEHNADILTTAETLHALLQLPGDGGSQWRIPAIVRKEMKGLVILDLPLPGPSNPRQCLSSGIQEALYQSLLSSSSSSSTKVEYTYSLMTLPHSNTQAKHHFSGRVLVRCRNRLVETNPKGERHPICILPQLEYFVSDHAWNERFTSYDKALWILEKVLQPSSRVLVAHVDPTRFQLIRYQETGVAHALAGEQETWVDHKETGPLDHLEAMAELLHATSRLPDGELLLQLSGTSVSVHMAEQEEQSARQSTTTTAVSQKDVSKVDVKQLLTELGGVVYTGPAALRQCARTMQWNAKRVPYTFPVEGERPKQTTT